MPESNSAVVLLVSVKIWLTCDRWASLFFCTKILSEDPYLKFFISRVRTKHRERFSSFSRYATRLSVEAFFLTALHRAVSTKAVNVPKYCCVALKLLFLLLLKLSFGTCMSYTIAIIVSVFLQSSPGRSNRTLQQCDA